MADRNPVQTTVVELNVAAGDKGKSAASDLSGMQEREGA
jgi:hypothetical protein